MANQRGIGRARPIEGRPWTPPPASRPWSPSGPIEGRPWSPSEVPVFPQNTVVEADGELGLYRNGRIAIIVSDEMSRHGRHEEAAWRQMAAARYAGGVENFRSISLADARRIGVGRELSISDVQRLMGGPSFAAYRTMMRNARRAGGNQQLQALEADMQQAAVRNELQDRAQAMQGAADEGTRARFYAQTASVLTARANDARAAAFRSSGEAKARLRMNDRAGAAKAVAAKVGAQAYAFQAADSALKAQNAARSFKAAADAADKARGLRSLAQQGGGAMEVQSRLARADILEKQAQKLAEAGQAVATGAPTPIPPELDYERVRGFASMVGARVHETRGVPNLVNAALAGLDGISGVPLGEVYGGGLLGNTLAGCECGSKAAVQAGLDGMDGSFDRFVGALQEGHGRNARWAAGLGELGIGEVALTSLEKQRTRQLRAGRGGLGFLGATAVPCTQNPNQAHCKGQTSTEAEQAAARAQGERRRQQQALIAASAERKRIAAEAAANKPVCRNIRVGLTTQRVCRTAGGGGGSIGIQQPTAGRRPSAGQTASTLPPMVDGGGTTKPVVPPPPLNAKTDELLPFDFPVDGGGGGDDDFEVPPDGLPDGDVNPGKKWLLIGGAVVLAAGGIYLATRRKAA